MVWLQIKVDLLGGTDGASSVRLGSEIFEFTQILSGHLGENNLLTMLSLFVCLPAVNKLSINFTGC